MVHAEVTARDELDDGDVAGVRLDPIAVRVEEVRLDVEDEFVAADGGAGGALVEHRFWLNLIRVAHLGPRRRLLTGVRARDRPRVVARVVRAARGREVHAPERRRHGHRAREEIPAWHADLARVLVGFLHDEALELALVFGLEVVVFAVRMIARPERRSLRPLDRTPLSHADPTGRFHRVSCCARSQSEPSKMRSPQGAREVYRMFPASGDAERRW